MRTGINDRQADLRNILIGWLRRRVSQRDAGGNADLRSGNTGRQTPIRSRAPLFKSGDSIYERFPMQVQSPGAIVQSYLFDGQYRYVVHFDDGREAVLFEKELTSAVRP